MSKVLLIEQLRIIKEGKIMWITILTRLRKIGKLEYFQEKERAEQPSNQNEKELKLEDARKHVRKILNEANEVRYFYTLNKENEQHTGFTMLEKAISTASLSDSDDINELKNIEIQLSRSIEQVNIYLYRRHLHTKIQQGSEMIRKLSTDNIPMHHYLVEVQDALKIANECHANYLSTACEIRNVFDQLNHAIQVAEIHLQPA